MVIYGDVNNNKRKLFSFYLITIYYNILYYIFNIIYRKNVSFNLYINSIKIDQILMYEYITFFNKNIKFNTFLYIKIYCNI